MIKNFSVIRQRLQQCQEKDARCLKSPTMFTVDGVDFHMRLWPDGMNEDRKGTVCIFLWRPLNPTIRNKVFLARFAVSIIADGQTKETSETSGQKEFFQLKADAGLGCVYGWDTIEGLLRNDALTLRINAEFCGGIHHSGIVAKPDKVQSSLAGDYRSLMETGIGSDVILKFSGGERRAHKLILQCRSPVFRRMFEHAMQETETGTVEITDADAESLDSFLLYLYTDEFPKTEIAGETLKLAKKYEVAGLVEVCSQTILSGLTVNNAAETLLLADTYGLTAVKEAAIDFMSRDHETIQAIQDTEAFDRLSKELVMKLFTALAKPKRKRTASLEFPDGSDWSKLTASQLRRACAERSLHQGGAKASLVERLNA